MTNTGSIDTNRTGTLPHGLFGYTVNTCKQCLMDFFGYSVNTCKQCCNTFSLLADTVRTPKSPLDIFCTVLPVSHLSHNDVTVTSFGEESN